MDDLFSLQKQGPLASSAAGFRAAGPFPTADGRYKFDIYVAGRGVSLALAETE